VFAGAGVEVADGVIVDKVLSASCSRIGVHESKIQKSFGVTMLKALFIVVAMSVFMSSASHAKTGALDLGSLKGRPDLESIVSTTGEPRFFFEDSVLSNFPLGSIFNKLGEKKGLEKGEEIARQFEIPDPALRISKELADAVSTELGIEVTLSESDQVKTPTMFTSKRKPRALAEAFGPGKLVVDVRSTSWAVSLVGKDRYRVGYWANAQIVDTSSGKVLASSDCVLPPKKAADLPLIAPMFDDGATQLKAEIVEASDKCLALFMSEILGSG
jgi:hypothetical protein